MAFPASAVMSEAAKLLIDEGGRRWPPIELLMWLNAGIRELLILKPTAYSQTVQLNMAAGTLQTLDDTHSNLIRVIRNLGAGAAGGRAIRQVDRESLDDIGLDWHDSAVVPQSHIVMHVVADTADPETFYVYPGNDGTGAIEAVVSIVHPELAAPADPSAIPNFTASIDLDDIYRNALVDYVCYRAFTKDELIAGAKQSAAVHYQQFAAALGARQRAELVANINTSGQEPAGRGG